MSTKKEKIEELKELYPAFFEAFPLNLIEFALSEDTARKIGNICIENKITDKEIVEGVAFRVTYVLFEKLPKENLFITLRDGLNIEEEKAKKMAKSIDEIIFSNIPKEESPTEKEDSDDGDDKEEEEKSTPLTPKKPSPGDVYREPIN
jgi:hypothetical protein